MSAVDKGASADADRATAVEPVPVSPLRDGIPSAIAAILDRAANLLAQDGRWIQGSLSRCEAGGPTCYCAMGAIFVAAEPMFGSAAVDFVEARLPPSDRPADLRPLAKWNDAPGRTQAEVVEMLRAQAIEARRAETAQTGSVHESAVGETDAPKETPHDPR